MLMQYVNLVCINITFILVTCPTKKLVCIKNIGPADEIGHIDVVDDVDEVDDVNDIDVVYEVDKSDVAERSTRSNEKYMIDEIGVADLVDKIGEVNEVDESYTVDEIGEICCQIECSTFVHYLINIAHV